MTKLYQIITNAGDGSNGLQYTVSSEVLQRMYDLADAGEEEYASGDGLQVKDFNFSSPASMAEFITMNKLSLCTVENRGDAWDWKFTAV